MPAGLYGKQTRKAGPSPREKKMPLPAPVPGEAFSILHAIKSCGRRTLTCAEAAELVGKSRMTISRATKKGKIPTLDLGLGEPVIDLKLWADQIELRNPHLVFTNKARAHRAA